MPGSNEGFMMGLRPPVNFTLATGKSPFAPLGVGPVC